MFWTLIKTELQQGYSDHKQCDVLENVGNVDMTADVDFDYLSTKLQKYDVTTFGPCSQRYFLRNMGLDILHEVIINFSMFALHKINLLVTQTFFFKHQLKYNTFQFEKMVLLPL